MALFTNKFDSAKQEWATPQSLFDALDSEFHFTCDLAADSTNKKCDSYFDQNVDGLKQTWKGTCWLNPPYGDRKYKLVDWIKKAHVEVQSGDCTVVLLTPARTNTKWWHDYCMTATEIRFLCGRPKFGGADHGLPQPLAIVVFSNSAGPTKYSKLKV